MRSKSFFNDNIIPPFHFKNVKCLVCVTGCDPGVSSTHHVWSLVAPWCLCASLMSLVTLVTLPRPPTWSRAGPGSSSRRQCQHPGSLPSSQHYCGLDFISGVINSVKLSCHFFLVTENPLTQFSVPDKWSSSNE